MATKKELTYRETLGFPAFTDPGIDCSKDPILTEQHHAEDLDINKIVERYSPKEILDLASAVDAVYGDFSDWDGLQAMTIKVEEAHDKFMALPASIRREFNNSADQMLRAIDLADKDPATRDRLETLGVITKKVSVGTITSSDKGAPPAEAGAPKK